MKTLRLMGDGVVEGDLGAVEMDRGAVPLLAAVAAIADDGMADGAELRANLMVTPRF